MQNHPAPAAEEECTYGVFCELNKTLNDYRRNLAAARKNDELISAWIECPTLQRMQSVRRNLEELFGNDKRYTIGTVVTGRKACLEAGIHDQYPVCPAWATDEERAWFETALAAHRSPGAPTQEKDTPFTIEPKYGEDRRPFDIAGRPFNEPTA